MAQAPKQVDKAKRAVFSVVTYDGNDKILNTGNGFFVGEDGTALSDYALFKGAGRAVAIGSDGVQMPVDLILGADDLYDVVKFRVATSGKKISALTVAPTAPAVGTQVYLLPYSTQKDRAATAGRVKAIDKASGQYNYYTIEMPLDDKMVSCPLMTADGQVFGLAQKSSGEDTASVCYAIDARFAMSRSISALSYNDNSLQNIGIRKALPDTEEQALVSLYMASSRLTADEYMEMLNDFVAQYPASADGYLRRAAQQLFMSKDDVSMNKVSADLDKALEVSAKKDDTRYNRAKMIYNYALGHAEKPYQDWTLDKALDEVRKAIAIDGLPVYVQLEGDILYAKQDYPSALAAYDKVNRSNMASAATFFSAARAKQMMEAPAEEILAQMDSCVSRLSLPYTEESAPYLLERAQARMGAGQARGAVQDYDAYYAAVNGKVNDMFYYCRGQAALKAKQFQRALDDMTKAIELNPADMTYRAELAVVNLRVGRYEEALNVLKSVVEKEPDYAEAYRLMGVAQVQLKNTREACALFAKAKELGDPHADALIEKHCK